MTIYEFTYPPFAQGHAIPQIQIQGLDANNLSSIRIHTLILYFLNPLPKSANKRVLETETKYDE
jgi:hypothetical protein